MQFDPMDLRLLRVFQTVVEAGGLSPAQGILNLSLATISTHISGLETRLGLTLCQRGRSGFSLTPEGRLVYQEFQRLSTGIDQFQTRISRLTGELSGTLIIGMADNTLTNPDAPLEQSFARLATIAPKVSLQLVTRPPDELLRDVVSGQMDIAIGSFPKIALGLNYLDLYTERQEFYCGLGHPLFAADTAQTGLDEIQRHRIVRRSYWGARDMKIFAVPGARAVVNDMESGARLILSGAYLGYLPCHFARQFVDSGRMRSLRPDLLGYSAPFQAAHETTERSGKARALFLDLLRETITMWLKMPMSPRRGSHNGTQ